MSPTEDELTAKMHSEFNVNDDIEIRNRALSAWKMCGYKKEHPKFTCYCQLYGLSPNQALMWYIFGKMLRDASNTTRY